MSTTTLSTISTDRTQELLDRDDAWVINVLDPKYYRKSHIPGSLNIPIGADDFLGRVASEVPDRDSTIVVYCAGPDCNASPRAARLLMEAGYSDVHDYEGGMKEWIADGKPTHRHGDAGQRT